MISIRRRNLCSLTKEEIKRLKQLTLRPGYSSLREDLNMALSYPKIGKDFIFFIAKIDGKIIGWSALTNFSLKELCCDFGVYVEAKYRRQGIASRLLHASERYIDKKYGEDFDLDAYPHDRKSKEFFKKNEYSLMSEWK